MPQRSLTRSLHAVVLALAVSLACPMAATGQFYFGKNKVQYTDFDWLVLPTRHFDIYFYDTERALAGAAAEAAEFSYRALADRFNHDVEHRIPLVVYSSPRFFSQTNVTPSLLPENVAGFTEFFKGRVVLPFNGSYADFRRVLQHELVHVFTISKLTTTAHAHKKVGVAEPPLWFTEGIAEYFSRPWEPDADMILSDLVLSGRFYNIDRLPAIAGTYLMYKEGESFCHFVAEAYGEEYLVYLLDNAWRGGDFESVAAITFSRPLREIGREWEYWLKKRYFPTIQSRELPDRVYKQRTKAGYNVKPVAIWREDDGQQQEWIVFKGNRLGYAGLYMTPGGGADGDPDRNIETLLKGERSPRFESLHLLGSSLDVSGDGRVVFSSTRHERDALYLLDLSTRRIIGEHRWDSLYNAVSPSFSPDGGRVVFAGGGQDGWFDLFVYDLDRRELRRLMRDWYFDTDPIFSADGQRIIFASDRGPHGDQGWLNLFSYDLQSGEIAPVYTGAFNARSPSLSPDGRSLLFTCDREGHSDIYRRDSSGRVDQLTHLVTGAFDPRFCPDGRRIVFTAYQNSSFQIFEMTVPDSTTPEVFAAADGSWAPTWRPAPQSPDSGLTKGAFKYRRQFSFDIAQSAVSYDAFYGTVGGLQTALTDVLGNHQYFFLLANNAETRDEFLQSFNAGVSYFNREGRLNYGYGAYHLYDDYTDPAEGPLQERQYGAVGYIGYPLSKFRRIEASLFLRHSDRDVVLGERRRAVLATQFISVVHDNSLWDVSGPIDGWRLMLAFGYTADLTNFRSFNRLLIADARKYVRLGEYSAFATRLLGHFSSGLEPQRRYLGGSWDLRGYPRRVRYARNVFLISNELRFPLIDALLVGLPMGSLGFQGIRGALFFDAGKAWEDRMGRLDGALGVGARVALGYIIVLRFDWARRTDFRKIDTKTRFEFFFGWNF
ncbi:MAG: BamA/TamA family outer membrane protein [Candidatus Zixiibacteriota bacterium]